MNTHGLSIPGKSLLTYFGFGVACVIVIVAFTTATTYTQLAIATILYPLLIFFAYKVLPFKSSNLAAKQLAETPNLQKTAPTKSESAAKAELAQSQSTINVTDINKRAFLKLLGATGLSFFIISVFGRRVESLLFGQNLTQIPFSGTNSQTSQTNNSSASPTDGYTISEIDDSTIGYYGFTNKNGGWFIMKEDSNTGSFRYTKGEKNFPDNWNNRQNLNYDYYHNVFF